MENRINFRWLLLMAWRDSRRNRSRLFLFISSIILGIAALVAIHSFGENLRKDINKQAASLLGADMVVSTNKSISPATRLFLDSLGNRRSEERSFASMVFFPKTMSARLIQVRAINGGYPYYGAIETIPVSAARSFRNGKHALVDKTMLLQFGAKVGDPVTIGKVTFTIAGMLGQAPGQSGIEASIAPVVYIPLQYLEQTGLMQRGSRISYKFYYQYDKPDEVEQLAQQLEPRFDDEGLAYRTIESQKRDTGRAFGDLTRFLSLVGFIALLLGSIGVASAIHVYVREKLPTIAILRCMGVQAYQAGLIYLIQIAGIGLAGSVLGAALGTVIQQLLPVVLKDLLPVTITSTISWTAIVEGIVLGLVISILFALLPLTAVRKISPLNTLRITFTETRPYKDPLKWVVYILVLVFVTVFSYFQLHTVLRAVVFTGSVVVAFLILSGAASLLIYLVRRFFPSSSGYLWRQGLSNLFRPNNQTLILVVSIGLGTGFISTLFFVQDILVNSVALTASGKQPNMIIFDIQSSQKDSIAALTRKHDLPIIQQVPIVTMKIEEVNGETAADFKKEPRPPKGQRSRQNRRRTQIRLSARAFSSELRASYRDTLTATEKVTEGVWEGKPRADGKVMVSLEDRYAQRIGVKAGDNIVFNVQGALIPAVVGSFRKVEWGRVQTNFRVLFPVGVLEDAPQFHVLVTRVPTDKVSARFQQDMVSKFPTVSIIDLGLILTVLDKIIDKIGFVIRFMAAFSIITGIIVLTASVLISKYQRIRESVLLRTLGATKRQILVITALEYFFLGSIASGTGIILSLAGSWALAYYSFDISFVPPVLPIFLILASITALTVLIGLMNSRDVVNRTPLEVLGE